MSAVEASPDRSHQHEFNGVEGLVQLFGKRESGDKIKYKTSFLYLDDSEECERHTDTLTWYESRKPPRTEHRLYYSQSNVTEKFQEGDLVIFCKRTDGTVMLIAARQGSGAERELLWLFSLSLENLQKVEYQDLSIEKIRLDFTSKLILEELGIEAIQPDNNLLDEMLRDFNGNLPSTKIFSEYARFQSGIGSSVDAPDLVLISWINREEELFRAFEKHLVTIRLQQGFGEKNDDVDAFIQFSLSVHNRRKARMGKSFELHLEHVFTEHKLSFSHGKPTERKRTPDFMFPGIEQYKDGSFPTERLTMLGAKSTCKERWAQVLNEADRIEHKHLITLERGISEDQTAEMESSKLQLVVPTEVQKTYTKKQQTWLMNLQDFIGLVKSRQ